MRTNLLLLLSLVLSVSANAQDPCDGLVVDFTFAPDPNGIAFTDASQVAGAITWYQWTFGDGNISFVQDPVHNFAVNGIYEVCLTIGTSIETPEGTVQCLDSTCYMVEYNEGGFSCDQYEASFTSEATEGNTVVFFSTSDPPGGNQFWQFGDGDSGAGQQVTHTFDTTGVFTVCLVSSIWNSSTDEFCTDAICLPVVVGDTLDCDGLVPTFSGTVVEGTTMIFEQTTEPPAIAYSWDLGDNTSAIGPMVEHTYATGGTYQVCLGAGWWNEVAQDTCWNYTCDLFNLMMPEECDPAVQIGFGWSQSDGLVSFLADGSVEAGGYFWDFGDAGTATGAMAEQEFLFGEHVVCLESWYLPNAISDTCWTIFCDTIVSASGSTDCSSMDPSFTSSSLSAGVELINTSSVPGLPIAIEWSYQGDPIGTGNELTYPFPAPGDHEVCLTITSIIGPIGSPDTCVATHCDIVTWVGADPCSGLEATFIGVENGPLQWIFESTTSVGPGGLIWDLGDGTTAIGGTVDHTFDLPGDHEVCLTAWWWNEALQDTCFSTTCELFTVNGQTGCDPAFAIEFTWEQNAGQFSFNATTQPIEGQVIWNFGDGTTGAGNAVDHLYEPPGPYQVCAIAWYWNEPTQDTCWAESCQEVDWITGGCDPGFIVEISADPDGNTVTFTASTSLPAMGHNWDLGDGSIASGGSVTHVFEPPGPYEVCVDSWYWDQASGDTCWAEACITVDPFVGMAEEQLSNSIVIHPQPARDAIMIDATRGSDPPTALQLFSTDGKAVRSDRPDRWPIHLSIGDLPAGVYILQLHFDDLRIHRSVIIQ